MTMSAKSTRTESVPKKSASPHTESPAGLHELRMPADGHRFDLRYVRVPWQRRREIGKALREKAPREGHAQASSGTEKRPDPLDLLAASNVGRQPDFIPLRMGRMAASPFTFL